MYAKTLAQHLNKKKDCYMIRVTTFIKGNTKNKFIEHCEKRNENESKVARHIFDVYYSMLHVYPELNGKEPNEIKKFIIDRIKLE